jgi:hypothetical protein
VPRWTVWAYAVVRSGERWHVRASELRPVLRGVHFSEVGMEGEVLGLLLGDLGQDVWECGVGLDV